MSNMKYKKGIISNGMCVLSLFAYVSAHIVVRFSVLYKKKFELKNESFEKNTLSHFYLLLAINLF